MALRVVATITASPGSEQVVREALVELAAASRAESGCNSYELYGSLAEGTVFVTIEEWTDQGALDAHMRTPHLQAALAAVGDQLTVPPAIHPLEQVS